MPRHPAHIPLILICLATIVSFPDSPQAKVRTEKSSAIKAPVSVTTRPAGAKTRTLPSCATPAPLQRAEKAQQVAPAEPGHILKVNPRNDPDHLHHAAIVIDTHCDVVMKILDDPEYDVGRRMSKGHVDLVRMKEGGLDAQFWAVFVYPEQFPGEQGWSRAQEMLDAIHGVVRTYPQRVQLALTAAQIRAAEASAKTALLIGLEGGHALGDFSSDRVVLDRVRQLHARGVRYLTLTWWRSNPLGGGSGDEEKAGGLTPLGRKVVALMNDLGMIVDLSHSAEPTFYDALKASRLPVLATHSATRSLADHHRNLSDDMLRALAKNGGALCLNFYTGFLDAPWGERYWKMSKEERAKVKRPPMSLLVDHLDHAVKVAGIDHVCLGSDYDGMSAAPVGLEDASKLPALTAELQRRGYSAPDIRKILGNNVLRIMEANQLGAKRR